MPRIFPSISDVLKAIKSYFGISEIPDNVNSNASGIYNFNAPIEINASLTIGDFPSNKKNNEFNCSGSFKEMRYLSYAKPSRARKLRIIKNLEGKVNPINVKWILMGAKGKELKYLDNLLCPNVSNIRRGNLLEKLAEHFYNCEGFQICSKGANRNKTCGDGGVDILAKKKSTKKLIECKNIKNKAGVGVVRHFVGVMNKFPKSYRGEIVSLHSFTRNVKSELVKMSHSRKYKVIFRDTNWILGKMIQYGVPKC